MKNVITERDILESYQKGKKEIVVRQNDILTPSAKDRMNDLKMVIAKSGNIKLDIPTPTKSAFKKVAIGADHTGFELKEILKKFLNDKGLAVIDVGTLNKESCDYPDFALAVAEKIISGEVEFGIIADATGIPSAITANKIPTIRAATCYNEFTAWSARSHNNANVLVVGAKTLGEEAVKAIINKWLETDFSGERHQKRLDKITDIENKLFKT
ncbi:MAG: ribose 5-phosphate isomerase B [Bacteroidota bacterium]